MPKEPVAPRIRRTTSNRAGEKSILARQQCICRPPGSLRRRGICVSRPQPTAGRSLAPQASLRLREWLPSIPIRFKSCHISEFGGRVRQVRETSVVDRPALSPSTSPKEANGNVAMKAQRVMSPRHTARLQPETASWSAEPVPPASRPHTSSGRQGIRSRCSRPTARGRPGSHGRAQGVTVSISVGIASLPRCRWSRRSGGSCSANELIDVPAALTNLMYKGHYYQYPLQVADVASRPRTRRVRSSPLELRLQPECGRRPAEENFEQWVSNRFGRRLYRIFFKTYTEKVWGMPCTEIRAEWAAQRIQGLSLVRALLSGTALNHRPATIKSLISQFKYPRSGPGQMWEACRDRVIERGGRVSAEPSSHPPRSRRWPRARSVGDNARWRAAIRGRARDLDRATPLTHTGGRPQCTLPGAGGGARSQLPKHGGGGTDSGPGQVIS